jgi:soluble lytic murein transglycosylase-like protein
MNSAHLSTRIQAGPKQRPVSRRILGLGAGLVAALLLLIGITFVHGGVASLMGQANPEDAAAPDTQDWLVTYSACDAPALSAPMTARVAGAVARVPEILAKDAVLKLPEAPREVRQLINEVAAEVKIAPALLHAVIATESRYNTAALSPRGAIGLMQLMPDTALRFGAPDPYNTRDNILAGANYLKFLLKLFGNDMELALAAYNAGHGAVMRAGNRIPEYPETMAYVPKVLAYMRCASNAACRPG